MSTYRRILPGIAQGLEISYLKEQLRFVREIVQTPSFRTLGVFAGGNLFVAVLGGLAGLLQARWIEPEVFGEFRKFGILTAYFSIGLVVVHDGLARQFPYLLGHGNKEAALEVAASAKWWYLLVCWAFSILFAGLSLTSVVAGDYRSAVGWGAQIPCIWAAIYGAYLGVMYRTSAEFRRLSYNSLISNLLGFAALIMVKAWGYWGLAARTALQSAAGLHVNRHHVPVKVRAAFDFKCLVDLAKMSLPLSIPGYVSTSCLTASLGLVILKYHGQPGLGIFGVALVFQTIAMTFTAALQQMFITKLTYRFGQTHDVSSCLTYAKRATLLSVGAASMLALVLCLVIDPFVHLLVPKYREAIPLIRILSVQLPLSAAGLPFIILTAALWYRSVIALALTRFLGCFVAIAVFPKTLAVIVACMVGADACALIVGFGILRYRK